jgi:hypothetical protein
MGRSFGASEASFAGVRSPPLREMAKRWGEGLPGANPEMARKAVFSEGRTPCVRVARPHVDRDISFPAHPLTMARHPGGDMPGWSQYPSRGRAEPAPPRDGEAKARRPSGGEPGDDAKGGFLGGTHSVRPRIRVESKPGHNIIIGGE